MTFPININYNNHCAKEGLAVSLLALGGGCAVKGGGGSQSCVPKGSVGVMGFHLGQEHSAAPIPTAPLRLYAR